MALTVQQLAEIDPEILTADGFEEALVGVARVFNTVVALYDRAKCIKVLMDRDGMTEDEAEEFFEFNVVGTYVGERTPAFASFFTDPEETTKSEGSSFPQGL